MNMQTLHRYYEHLTVWERIPLLVAAGGRDDQAEYDRLTNSAPLRSRHIRNHMSIELGLNVFATIHVAELLEAAAWHFYGAMRIASGCDDPLNTMLVHSNAHAYNAKSEAWRLFCAEIGVDGETLARNNHHGAMLEFCDEIMPTFDPDLETLQAAFENAGVEFSALRSMESRVAEWRNLCRKLTLEKPPPGLRPA